MQPADEWIKKLRLKIHPEGGYYREVYRSGEYINDLPGRYDGARVFATSIFYLLKGDQYSAFHRLSSDEIWHFYEGCSLTVFIITRKGDLIEKKLGKRVEEGESFQLVIERDQWFAARPDDPDGYTLAGCAVSPGFDFKDFRIGDQDELLRTYPGHQEIIRSMAKQGL